METKSQKPYPVNENILIVQGLRGAHYQIFSIILLKEFIKLNTKTVISAVLNTEMLKMIY